MRSLSLCVVLSLGCAALGAQAGPVRANVPEYKVARDLSNVANLKVFGKELSAEEKALIAKNLFVVTPTNYVQLFHVYENNEYQRPEKFPAFITTDSMLHTYHVFYNYSLRVVESTKLYDACVKLTNQMLARAVKDKAAASGKVKAAATRNIAYFGVAQALLRGSAPKLADPDAQKLAAADYKAAMAHAGRGTAQSAGSKIDFTQFVPRGHYTRTEKLKRYFRGMMWYGQVPFAVKSADQTVQALLISRSLAASAPTDKLWQTVYEPTVFYVGKADDLTAALYNSTAKKTFGRIPTLADLGSSAKVAAFQSAAKKLPAAGIENFSPELTMGPQFRFMGQRFILDSRFLQELTHPKVNKRNWPFGLDVFAALGSDRALSILKKDLRQSGYVGYDKQMAKMRAEAAAVKEPTWKSNLYYGWLWALKALTVPAPQGYPSFMRSAAWMDKNLLTCLGSWTELRHDTILYAKQSVAECGDGEEEPPMPKGYVEPNLEFWTRLAWLNDATMKGLAKRKLLNADLKDSFEKIGDWLTFCKQISLKELTGQKVTREEYAEMSLYGAELDFLNQTFAGGDLISEADLDMAVVADVHTSFDEVLEEGTGRAGAIYVVVPIEGKLYLTRGATFTQYEFRHPSSDRLTDEAWQKMLKEHREPAFPAWMKSFLHPKGKKLADDFESSPGGC